MSEPVPALGWMLLLMVLAGCATPTPHMIPTPVAYKHPSLDFLPKLPPELRSTEVPVFYATTRAPALRRAFTA